MKNKIKHDAFSTVGQMIRTKGQGQVRRQEVKPVDDNALDFERGANFVPNEVMELRKQSIQVPFVKECDSSCCWYWELPDGSRIYHWRAAQYNEIARSNGNEFTGCFSGDAGACSLCGNENTKGGLISAQALSEQKQSAK